MTTIAPYLQTGEIYNRSRRELVKSFPGMQNPVARDFHHHRKQAILATIATVALALLVVPIVLEAPQFFFKKIIYHKGEMEKRLQERINSCKEDFERTPHLTVRTDKGTYEGVSFDDLKAFLDNNRFSLHAQFKIFSDIAQGGQNAVDYFYEKEIFKGQGDDAKILAFFKEHGAFENMKLEDLETLLAEKDFSPYARFKILQGVAERTSKYDPLFNAEELFAARKIRGNQGKVQFSSVPDHLIEFDFRNERRSIKHTSRTSVISFQKNRPFLKNPILQTFQDKVHIDHARNTISVKRYIAN